MIELLFHPKKIIYYYISKQSLYFRTHSQWKFRKALTSDIQKPSVMLEERVDIFAASLISYWEKDSDSFDRSGSLWAFLKNAWAFLSSHKKCFNIQKYLTCSWRASSYSRIENVSVWRTCTLSTRLIMIFMRSWERIMCSLRKVWTLLEIDDTILKNGVIAKENERFCKEKA